MWIGYILFFTSELSTERPWHFGLMLVGPLGFLSMSIFAIVMFIVKKESRKIKKRQIWSWLFYIIFVTMLTLSSIYGVIERQLYWFFFFCIYMTISATWTVCIYLNDIEDKEKLKKEEDTVTQ
jgi:quinol-cytochrome oxidoreductase complex cytochrome b subunit